MPPNSERQNEMTDEVGMDLAVAIPMGTEVQAIEELLLEKVKCDD